MKRIACLLTGILFAVGVGAANASVISFTNEALFLAAAGSTTTENFDSLAAGSAVTSLPSIGVSSVTTNGENGSTQAEVASLPVYLTDSTHSGNQFLASEVADPTFATAGLNFSLSGTATAVGLWVTDVSPLGGFVITLFDGATNVGSFTFGPQTVPDSFVGLTSSLAFNRVFVDAENEFDSWGLDDLTLNTAQVPEPTTLALLGFGLAGAVVRRRQRQ
jgi:hypothetical protein